MLPQGDYLFQRLSLDESLVRTHEVYRKGVYTFLMISTVVLFTYTFLWSMVCLPLLKVVLFGSTSVVLLDPVLMQLHPIKFMVIVMVQTLLSISFTSIATGGMIQVVADIYADHYDKNNDNSDNNNNNSHYYWFQCLKVGGINKAPKLITISILTLLGRVIGFHLLFIPGIYLMFTWIIVYPVIVLEDSSTSIITLLRQRCHDLVKSSWFYVCCTFLSVYTVVFFVKIIWSFLLLEFHNSNVQFMETDDGGFTFHRPNKLGELYLTMVFQSGQMVWSLLLTNGDGPGHKLLSIKDAFLSVLPELFILPTLAILQTVMYFNLRVEKESMNFEALLGDLERQQRQQQDSTSISIEIGDTTTTTSSGGGGTVMMTMNANNYGDYAKVSLLDNNNNNEEEEKGEEGIAQQQQQRSDNDLL